MRELVYVSEAKLRQISNDLPSKKGRLRNVEAEVSTPVGGLKVGKAAGESRPYLAAAVRALDSSPRATKWFAQSNVRPGDWVHFEAPLSFDVVRDAVAFVDINESSSEYPSGGSIRLLLHGSAYHMIGHDIDRTHFGPLAQTYSYWPRFLRALNDLSHNSGEPSEDWGPWISDSVDRLTRCLRPDLTSSWMAGWARVTAVVPCKESVIIGATPLYVEYTEPPSQDTTSNQ